MQGARFHSRILGFDTAQNVNVNMTYSCEVLSIYRPSGQVLYDTFKYVNHEYCIAANNREQTIVQNNSNQPVYRVQAVTILSIRHPSIHL